MSGSRAKTDRRVAAAERESARLNEALHQAHDRLHKDDVAGCHDMLHQGMGAGDLVSDVAPMTDTGLPAFDKAFRELCLAHGATASFILAISEEGGSRIMSGGNAALDGFVTDALRQHPPTGVS